MRRALIAGLVAVSWLFAAAPLTVINALITWADGSNPSGTATITWKGSLNNDRSPIFPGKTTITITSGVVSVSLYPNDVALPPAGCYTVDYVLNATKLRKYWYVPTSASPITDLKQIEGDLPCPTQSGVIVAPSQVSPGPAGQTLVLTSVPSGVPRWLQQTSTGPFFLPATYGNNLQATVNAACAAIPGAGATVLIPNSTLSLTATVSIPCANLTIEGQGRSSIITTTANALLQALITVPSAASGFKIRNLVLDGNRANSGTAQLSSSNQYALLNIHASHTRVLDCELRLGQATGVFFGDDTTAPADLIVSGNYLHDIGGALNASGWGTGVYLSSSGQVSTGVQILGNHFEEIHNTVIGPGPSGCVNAATANDVIVANNFCKNAYNVTGGMIVAGSSATASCAGLSQNWTITGNTIIRTGSFADNTAGVELCATNVTVSGNTITSQNQGGITVDASASNVAVSGNMVLNSGSCVTVGGNLAGGSASHVTITGNRCTGGLYGLLLNYTGVDWVTATGNDISGNTTPLSDSSIQGHVFIWGNPGYDPPSNGTGNITPGASPWSYTAGHSPEMVTITGGTVSAVNVNGSNVCTATGCFFRLEPNQQIIITYSVAPSFNRTVQ